MSLLIRDVRSSTSRETVQSLDLIVDPILIFEERLASVASKNRDWENLKMEDGNSKMIDGSGKALPESSEGRWVAERAGME